MKHQLFVELIEHAPILERHQALFGAQTQLLQFDLLRQGPNSTFPNRAWHRDFSFPGERPLSVNTILFLDDRTEEVGPPRVVPGSHRGEAMPSRERVHDPSPNEVALLAKAGDAVFINSAIWHSGGRNSGAGLRRGIYLYYGFWWLKRYENDVALPWQTLDSASQQRLQLLGVKMPNCDLHQYQP